MSSVKLYQGDCIKNIQSLIKDGVKVDLILTDPPYNISKKNNFHTMGQRGIDFGEWDKGFDLYLWIDSAVQLLNKNGSMIIFNDWKNLGNIARYAETLGMEIKDLFRWEKDNPIPRNRDRRYITDFEMAVWLTKKKGKWTFNRHSDTYERPLFKAPLVGGKEKTIHPTQKPISLMEHLLKIHSNEGDIILDPFMGSGSTGVACQNLDRNFIGIELDETYFNVAKERIERAWNT